jgi:Protein of unknown function (DUF4239)
MKSTALGLLVFACTFGGALCGMWLRRLLPDHHLSSESRDSVKVGVGLVATITALVLGLVTASAKSSFDSLDAAVKHFAADLLSMDRALAGYGAEAGPLRAEIKRTVAQRIEQIWQSGNVLVAAHDPAASSRGLEAIAAQIRKLAPQNDEQRALKDRAANLAASMLDARWAVFVGSGGSIPTAFLVTLVFWLTVTFTSYGMLAPRNATVLFTLVVCALSVAGAVFLILEMSAPFEGVIRVSAEPMRFALERLGQ